MERQTHAETTPNTAGIDTATLLKIAQALSGDLHLDVLIDRLLMLMRETIGVGGASLVLGDMSQSAEGHGLWVLAGYLSADGEAVQRPGRLLDECGAMLPTSVILQALGEGVLKTAGHPVSGVCLPLMKQGRAVGALYLEHAFKDSVPAEDRLEFLNLVSGQIVNAIENARLYGALSRLTRVLEARVAERTRELEASETRMRAALVHLPIPTFVSRLSDSRILFANPRGAELFGLTAEEAIGTKGVDWYAEPRDRGRVIDLILRQSHFTDLEMQFRDRHGVIRWVLMSGGIFDFDCERAMLTTMIDVTHRRVQDAELRHHAEHDGLTGLLNRRTFTERLEGWIDQMSEDAPPLALLYMDLDRFKTINDTFGHTAGDMLLKSFGERVKAILPDGAMMARLGGDEFVLATREDAAGAVRIAEGILETARTLHEIDGQMIPALTTIGIACRADAKDNVSNLMKKADLALYRAKQAGRDTYRLFDGQLQASHSSRVKLEGDLKRGFERGEFHLHYQPLVCLQTGKVRSVEALLRWNNRRLGAIAPTQFIPVAEETGFITPLGAWVLREACDKAAAMPEETGISVNISPAQFRAASLSRIVLEALEQSGLAPGRLTLEITESLLLAETPDVRSEIDRLKQIGVRLALDDFGTGFAGFGSLRSLPFDQIKIDRSFVADITADRNAGLIVASIANLGHGLGMDVVAEGIETIEQLVAVKTAGCSQGQGYFFSRPMAAESLLFEPYPVALPSHDDAFVLSNQLAARVKVFVGK